jgi:mRNA interferase RelE/StbE
VAEYRLTVKSSAAKDLDRLDERVASRVIPKLKALASNPRPPGVKKIKGQQDLWRIRVGDWRVIYAIDDGKRIVDIVYVRHPSKAYE